MITNEGVVVASVLNLKVYLSLFSHKQFVSCIFSGLVMNIKI